MPMVEKKGSGKIWGIVVAALVVLGGIGYAVFGMNSGSQPVPPTPTPLPPPNPLPTPQPVVPPPPPPVKKSVYKDGTYTAVGNYNSPGGDDQIQVTVTLKNDIITDATVTSLVAMGGPSKLFQNQFIAGFKQQVIGKNIADVRLTKVSGSSLTPLGWNDAIAKIEGQAKA